MIYQIFQAHSDLMRPARVMAKLASSFLGQSDQDSAPNYLMRSLAASSELFSRADMSFERPAYGIDSVRVGNMDVPVREEAAHVMPFGTLLHFKKEVQTEQPRVLLVAPMSGHFATLLRSTVRTMLPEHDVYITDWHNAQGVSLKHGRFDFDDFIDYLIRFLEVIGPDAHVIAVCQPCVAVLAAVSIMAESKNRAQPRSMTLMAGPIDTRVNPTKVNHLAMGKPIEWFERNLIGRVPLRYPGAMRRVYPGFLQLSAFMSMNLDRHVKAHVDLYGSMVKGEIEKAETVKTFYDEYFAVMDLPAEFYLQTVKTVFQTHELGKGTLVSRGRPIHPKAIRRTALLTVEGERDDICGIGQTMAAHDLCSGLKPYMKRHHVQMGVGHYGVFSGRRWETQIYPMVKHIIQASA